MTNYLSGSTDVTQVNAIFGDYIQLAVDYAYSLLAWTITLVQDNFDKLLILTAIVIVGGMGYRFILKKVRMRGVKA